MPPTDAPGPTPRPTCPRCGSPLVDVREVGPLVDDLVLVGDCDPCQAIYGLHGALSVDEQP